MVSTYEQKYNICNDQNGFMEEQLLKKESIKNEFESLPEQNSPSSMITPTKESSSPSSSTEPTSMRSDKSGSRVPSEDKMDVTGLELPENDRSLCDASLSPTRERKMDHSLPTSCYSTPCRSDYMQPINSNPGPNYSRFNSSDPSQYQKSYHCHNHNIKNKYSYYDLQANQSSYGQEYPSHIKPDINIPNNHRNSAHFKSEYTSQNIYDNSYPYNNFYYNRQLMQNGNYYQNNALNYNSGDYGYQYNKGQQQNYYPEFSDSKINGKITDSRINQKPQKMPSSMSDLINQNRKRISPTPNNIPQKNSKRKKTETANKSPTIVRPYEFDPRSLLDDPKVLLISPEVQVLSDILPPDPKPKFINPSSESGLPVRMHGNYFNDENKVQENWSRKYESFSFDISLMNSATCQELSREFNIELEKMTSTELLLYEYLLKFGDRRNALLHRKRLEVNLLTKTRDNCAIRVSTNETDYFLPPSPDDPNFISKEPCEFGVDERCTTPTLRTSIIDAFCSSSFEPLEIDNLDSSKHIKDHDLKLSSETVSSCGNAVGHTKSNSLYRNEIVMKIDSLRDCSNELVCINCSMQIIPRSRALYPSIFSATNQASNTASAFCSFQCLKSKYNSKNANQTVKNSSNNTSMSSLINSSKTSMNANHSSDLNSLSSILSPSDHFFLDVPVIIQNYTPIGRMNKSNKRQTDNGTIGQSKIRRQSGEDNSTLRRWAGIRWLRHTPNGLLNHLRSISDRESLKINAKITFENTLNSSIIKRANGSQNDTRTCKLCGIPGDGDEDLLGRLLNFEPDVWIHLNCALWCFETYETISGSLMEVTNSVERALKTECSYCKKLGAGLPCFFVNCSQVYHLKCAKLSNCSFYTDRGMFCQTHTSAENSKFILDSLCVSRKVYIERDEDNLVEKILQNDESKKLRIGSFILESLGQLLPEQLSSGHFNDSDFIYPIGYASCRFFWSTSVINRRSLYKCLIEETQKECRLCEKHSGTCKYSYSPKFIVNEYDENGNLIKTFSGLTTRQAWEPILKQIEKMRLEAPGKPLKFFSRHCNSDFLFGFHEPHVIRGLESLPGIEYLCGYKFKFGRTQLISEMPLAVNPSGCARSEPKLSTFVKRRNSQLPFHFNISSHTPTHSVSVNYQISSEMSPTSRSIVQSKSLQYRKLKSEWKSNVLLSRSRIQGFGLYAAKDIERGSFIIEYLGETIRNEVANRRERLYESQNRGVYMFRADEDKIVDATMSGGLARYINHSCSPNCIAEVIIFDGSSHIVIIANRKIERGEELTYDYKFDLEEEKPNERIPCLCGSRNCRKWMN